MKRNTLQILSWGTTIFAALCGLVAFAMIFITAIRTNSSSYSIFQSEYSGLQVALGCSTAGGHPIFNASAGLILAFAFPLLAACAAVMGKGFKAVAGVSAAAMIAGGALALAGVSLLSPAIELASASLGAGLIASGVLSLLGGAALCASICVEVLMAKRDPESEKPSEA